MKDEIYQKHSMTLVKDVIPGEDLRSLINIFMIDSGVNMGSEFTVKSLERVIRIVEESYKFIPIYIIASGFKKGSMGQYGPGRLVPRVIGEWLNQISREYNRDMAHEAIQHEDYSTAADLHKYPIGQAIIKKIEWYQDGKINGDDWDNINLQALTDAIAKGAVIRLSDFLEVI